MSIWSKLGKIGLAAAPYVAAPFTGGASLLAAPATNTALKKWNEHDATENMRKGLGPSSFDRIVGGASDMAGMASDAGMLGKFGAGKYDMEAARNSRTGKLITNLGGGATGLMNSSRGLGPTVPPIVMNQTEGGNMGGQFGNYQGNMRGLGPVMGRRDQNNPNLAESFGAGRMDAMRSQPFRQGYDITNYGPEPTDDSAGNAPTETIVRMPPIYPTGRRRRVG